MKYSWPLPQQGFVAQDIASAATYIGLDFRAQYEKATDEGPETWTPPFDWKNGKTQVADPPKGNTAQVSKQDLLFSVIVPSRRRPKQLKRLLSAIGEMDYPPSGFEVIVVMDGDRQSHDEVLESDISSLPGLTILVQDHAGPAAARNHGASFAVGRYLAFTDDDCCPASGWLSAVEKALLRYPGSLIGGKVIAASPSSLLSLTNHVILDSAYRFYNKDPLNAAFFGAGNMIVPAQQFRSLCGFNCYFRTAEDREFCNRWNGEGFRMVYTPEAVVFHEQKENLSSFLWRHFQYGRGAYQFHRLRARKARKPMTLSPLAFYCHLFRYPFQQIQMPQNIVIGMLVILSQVASAAGFLKDSLGGVDVGNHQDPPGKSVVPPGQG